MWDQLENFFTNLPAPAWNLLLLGLAVLSGFIFKAILKWLLSLYAGKQETGFSFFRAIVTRVGKPANYFLPILVTNWMLPLMQLPPKTGNVFDKTVSILLIISFAAVLIGIIKVGQDFIVHKYDMSVQDNLRVRKVRTQLLFVRNIAITIVVLLAFCAILLSFESMRRIGTGLLTGVGIGGIIIGFAAQRSLGNLLAGFQIAFTQPIRIDDAVLVEGEWGKVEEITLTYVVVRIWDQRRLILPINYFIEKPFQNWTRTGAEIIGTVFLYLDYTIPLDAVRKEFDRLLTTTELWNKRVSVVQVTNTTERTLEIRFLVSAWDSGKAFDLRCYLRENLVTFIQKNYPQCLPQTRISLEADKSSALFAAPTV
ncbi:MAG: mechanosensitive ion channel [Chitinophagaceae bacterium]